MAAGRSPWPHAAAAATETRISACTRPDITWHARPNGHPCSVRLHGDVFVSREHPRAIMRANSVDVTTDHDTLVVRELDHRVEVADPAAAFRSREACRDLIHAALAEAPATREYDLAAGNWEEFLPDALAARIVAGDVRDGTAGFVLDIRLFLWIKLVDYSEPKALLLACKEAAGVSASGQKRRRRVPGELCAICLAESESESERGTQDEETVRLPCSHDFHGRCIERWFRRKSTCPTCRRDVAECLGFARSASPVDPVVGDE
ncbi:hypothetical protein ZWY2020_027174 [Hordeum vulgare]|nr:hypothetical protein ZWY2020_027174 [Hordeum vulgare]